MRFKSLHAHLLLLLFLQNPRNYYSWHYMQKHSRLIWIIMISWNHYYIISIIWIINVWYIKERINKLDLRKMKLNGGDRGWEKRVRDEQDKKEIDNKNRTWLGNDSENRKLSKLWWLPITMNYLSLRENFYSFPSDLCKKCLIICFTHLFGWRWGKTLIRQTSIFPTQLFYLF